MSDIRILSVNEKERASYSFRDQPISKISGVAHLAQVVINYLTTTPGSDSLNDTKGGGLVDLCRQYRANNPELKQKISERIDRTELQIQQEQSQLNLPDSEKLSALELISITRDSDNPTQLNIEIGVRSISNQSARLAI
jgi:hypothetical protein